MSDEFLPDWTSAPGESISEILEFLNKTPEELAKKMGFTESFITDLLEGKAEISGTVAIILSSALRELAREAGVEVTQGSMNPKFWLKREENYRKDLIRLGRT